VRTLTIVQADGEELVVRGEEGCAGGRGERRGAPGGGRGRGAPGEGADGEEDRARPAAAAGGFAGEGGGVEGRKCGSAAPAPSLEASLGGSSGGGPRFLLWAGGPFLLRAWARLSLEAGAHCLFGRLLRARVWG